MGRLQGPAPVPIPSLGSAQVSHFVGGLPPGMLVVASPGQQEASGLSQLRTAGKAGPGVGREASIWGASQGSRSHAGAQARPGLGTRVCTWVCVLRVGRRWLSAPSVQGDSPTPSLGQVAGLFHDPSIGNPIHVTVVRLVLLEEEEVRGRVASRCPVPGAAQCGRAPGRAPSTPQSQPSLRSPRGVPAGGVVRLELDQPTGLALVLLLPPWASVSCVRMGCGSWPLGARGRRQWLLCSVGPGRPEDHTPCRQHSEELLQVAEEHQHEGGRPPAAPRHRHPAHQVLAAGGARGPRRREAGDGIPSALGDIFLY